MLLSQNLDGTYSHVDVVNAPNEEDGTDYDETESENINGRPSLLLPSPPPGAENIKASISLDTVMNLEETLTKMDDGTLPPHIHPSIPTEMLVRSTCV